MKVPRDVGNTGGADGFDYELKMATLMAAFLSQNEDVSDFQIVSNPKGVRDFDDIVVKVDFKDPQKESMAAFCQLKLSDKILWLEMEKTERFAKGELINNAPSRFYVPLIMKQWEKSFIDLKKDLVSKAEFSELNRMLTGVDQSNYAMCVLTSMSQVESQARLENLDPEHPILILDATKSDNYRQFKLQSNVQYCSDAFLKNVFVFLNQPHMKAVDSYTEKFLSNDFPVKIPVLHESMKSFLRDGDDCGVFPRKHFKIFA